MTPKAARRRLAVSFHLGADAAKPEFRSAVQALGSSSELMQDYDWQKVVDAKIGERLMGLEIPAEIRDTLEPREAAFRAAWGVRRGHKPAMLSVILGFLLLVGLLTWHFLRSGDVFPEEALSIASEGARLQVEQFEVVEEPAGLLADWFLLKGFERFHVPSQFANYQVVGARIFKIEGQPVAVLAVPENFMFFMVFDPIPFGIRANEEGTWRTVAFEGNHAAALRFDNGMCFMVVIKGTPADLAPLLRGRATTQL